MNAADGACRSAWAMPAVLQAILLLGVTSGCGERTASRSNERLEGGGRAQTEVLAGERSREPEASGIVLRRQRPAWIGHVKYSNGGESKLYTILEIVGGGVAAIDYERDGSWDLFFPGGGSLDAQADVIDGEPSTLIRNVGQGARVQARLGTERLYSHGAAVADWNQDGFSDLLIYGHAGVLLFFNQGDGTFSDATERAGLLGLPWTSSVAYADLNGDQRLDLYGACYVNWTLQDNFTCPAPDGRADVCSPNAFEGRPDWVRLAGPDGTFSEWDGLQADFAGRGLGVVAFRPDREQPLSLMVANDMQPNFWFTPDANGRSADGALLQGLAVDDRGSANASMGLEVFDLENDGKFDLFVTHFDNELQGVYCNQGQALFRHATRSVGLASPSIPAQVDFGIVAADWDGDRDEDVFYVAGHVQYFPDRGQMQQTPVLLENRGQRRLVRVASLSAETCELGVGRGAIRIDWNGDGRPDIVTTDLLSSPRLYENATQTEHQWLVVDVVGTVSPRTAIGAIVEVEDSDGAKQYRQVCGGGSYLSSNQSSLFFGLAEHSCQRVTVYWPSGLQDTVEGPFRNQKLLVVEQGSQPES